MKRDAIRDAGLRELGANARLRKISYNENGSPRPFEERCRLLKEYKAKLKTLHREMALECHPDRNMEASEDDRKTKEERFKRITSAFNFLMGLKPVPAQPVRRPIANQPFPVRSGFAVIINLGNRGMGINDLRYGTGTATSQNTSSGGHWPWHG